MHDLAQHERRFLCPHASDKSWTHRALMLAGMATGQTKIFAPLDGEDCLATRNALGALGVQFEERIDERIDQGVKETERVWIVTSPGIDRWHSPAMDLDLGNSGTSARLLLGLLAGSGSIEVVTLTGDESLRRRPMGRVVEPLRDMGAAITSTHHNQEFSTILPLTITKSALLARTTEFNIASAQIKSSILLAALSADGQTLISLPAGSRDHTEIMLGSLGAEISTRTYLGRESIQIVGKWRPPAFFCRVPNDPSSMAFFAAMAAFHEGLIIEAREVLYNPTRLGFFRALERMGMKVVWRDFKHSADYLGETVGTVEVSKPKDAVLKAITIEAHEIPTMIDELPLLAIIAAKCKGVSLFKGLGELRVKESDRIQGIVELLASSGVKTSVSERADLEITGDQVPQAFSFSSQDHRLVMTAMIWATVAPGESKIEGMAWIKTSFPLFLESFQNILAQ